MSLLAVPTAGCRTSQEKMSMVWFSWLWKKFWPESEKHSKWYQMSRNGKKKIWKQKLLKIAQAAQKSCFVCVCEGVVPWTDRHMGRHITISRPLLATANRDQKKNKKPEYFSSSECFSLWCYPPLRNWPRKVLPDNSTVPSTTCTENWIFQKQPLANWLSVQEME